MYISICFFCIHDWQPAVGAPRPTLYGPGRVGCASASTVSYELGQALSTGP